MRRINLLKESGINAEIEQIMNEIQSQLTQHSGYPFSKAQLRGALKNIAEGNFLGTAGVDTRFEHILTTDPLTIPEISINKIQEECWESEKYSSFSSGYFREECWIPSSPIKSGSTMQITLYRILTKHFDDCVQFVKYMGGTYPNLLGLITAQRLIGDKFPTICERSSGFQALGARITGIDKKNHCVKDNNETIRVACLDYSITKKEFEFNQVPWDGPFCGPFGAGNEYLVFYYECE